MPHPRKQQPVNYAAQVLLQEAQALRHAHSAQWANMLSMKVAADAIPANLVTSVSCRQQQYVAVVCLVVSQLAVEHLPAAIALQVKHSLFSLVDV